MFLEVIGFSALRPSATDPVVREQTVQDYTPVSLALPNTCLLMPPYVLIRVYLGGRHSHNRLPDPSRVHVEGLLPSCRMLNSPAELGLDAKAPNYNVTLSSNGKQNLHIFVFMFGSQRLHSTVQDRCPAWILAKEIDVQGVCRGRAKAQISVPNMPDRSDRIITEMYSADSCRPSGSFK